MNKRNMLCFLIVAVVFLGFNTSSVKATGRPFYVSGIHNDTQVYGSSGMQVTHFVSVVQEQYGGCASFVVLNISYYNWAAIGFYQGHNYSNGQFYNYPRYYYDYKINGSYHFYDLGTAPSNQNHSYSVKLIREQPYPDKGIIILSIDNSSKGYLYGYTYTGGQAKGESESHNSQNTMDYHFSNMQYAISTGSWYPFRATQFLVDSLIQLI